MPSPIHTLLTQCEKVLNDVEHCISIDDYTVIEDFTYEDDADEGTKKDYYEGIIENCFSLLACDIKEDTRTEENTKKKENLDRHLLQLIKEILKIGVSENFDSYMCSKYFVQIVTFSIKYNAYELFIELLSKARASTISSGLEVNRDIEQHELEAILNHPIYQFLEFNSKSFIPNNGNFESPITILMRNYEKFKNEHHNHISKTYPHLSQDKKNKVLNWMLCLHVKKKVSHAFNQPKPIKFYILSQTFDKDNDINALCAIEETLSLLQQQKKRATQNKN